MKKIGVLLLFLCFSLSWVACDPNQFQFNYEELKGSVTRVELINYNNPDAKELFDARDEVIPFDFAKMEIIETLPDEKLDNFLKDLSEVIFMTVWRHLDSPQGMSVRILYDTGDFEVISYNVRYSGSFNAEGMVKRFFGTGMDSELFNKYFETQVG